MRTTGAMTVTIQLKIDESIMLGYIIHSPGVAPQIMPVQTPGISYKLEREILFREYWSWTFAARRRSSQRRVRTGLGSPGGGSHE